MSKMLKIVSSDFCAILYTKLTHSFFVLLISLFFNIRLNISIWRFKHPVFFANLEDPGVDGRIILRWIFRMCDVGGMDSIDVAQDRDGW